MKDNINLDEINTEQRNPLTMHIDKESTEGIIRLMNSEDAKVAVAVEKETPNIVKAGSYTAAVVLPEDWAYWMR